METGAATIPRESAFRVAGYQKWRNLLFLHWRISPDVLQRLLPDGLTVETFDDSAWVGLVAFDMQGIRPWWFPPLPGISAFHETNVRTYVTRDGEDPGVWFFSLDAAGSLAVSIARRRWHLNYYFSRMKLQRDGERIAYESQRFWPEPRAANSSILAEIGMAPGQSAVAGTWEHFLVERYVMYARKPDGRLLRGQVRHVPYPLKPATVLQCDETLLAAAGIQKPGDPVHAVFSEGVDVDIGPLVGLPAVS